LNATSIIVGGNVPMFINFDPFFLLAFGLGSRLAGIDQQQQLVATSRVKEKIRQQLWVVNIVSKLSLVGELLIIK
jgi:hypothetical protein